MRLAETATVSKFERSKALCVGVAADLVLRPFFEFFEISHWRARIWTVLEQRPRTKRCAWLKPPPCPNLSVKQRCALELRLI